MLTMQHDLVFSIYCMKDPRDFLRQTSPDILPVEESSFYIWQTLLFGCHPPLYIPEINIQHQTNLWRLQGWLETPATWSYTQLNSSGVECETWLLLIPLGLEGTFRKTSHFCLFSSSAPCPCQQIMTPCTPEPGVNESELSRPTGPLSIGLPAGIQQ